MLRILSFNIRYHNPQDGVHAWPRRKERVASLLRLYRPDLMGLQEVLRDQLDDLRRRLPGFGWVGVGRDDGRDQGEFAPIFYRRNRLDLLESDTFWLSETPARPGSLGWDAACVRIATWARFTDRATGRTFLHLNTHLDHRGEQAQVESARLLRKFLAERTTPDLALITGDFNCTADSEPYALLTNAVAAAGSPLADAMLASETPHHGPSGTLNSDFTDPLRDKIDYIFTWQSDGESPAAVDSPFVVHAHAVLADQWDGHYPSDHLPVLADIGFDKEAASSYTGYAQQK
jgi:endonuclease/exonuclease/phosphatase family metal-dependent hydrolase